MASSDTFHIACIFRIFNHVEWKFHATIERLHKCLAMSSVFFGSNMIHYACCMDPTFVQHITTYQVGGGGTYLMRNEKNHHFEKSINCSNELQRIHALLGFGDHHALMLHILGMGGVGGGIIATSVPLIYPT